MTDNSAALAAVSAGERKINICTINEMVTCKICSGYLVRENTSRRGLVKSNIIVNVSKSAVYVFFLG